MQVATARLRSAHYRWALLRAAWLRTAKEVCAKSSADARRSLVCVVSRVACASPVKRERHFIPADAAKTLGDSRLPFRVRVGDDD